MIAFLLFAALAVAVVMVGTAAQYLRIKGTAAKPRELTQGEQIAALEAEVLEPVDELIARIDRELNPPKPRRGAQVALAPASWWPEGGRTNLPPAVPWRASAPGGIVKANVFADGRRATPWVESGARFTPTCDACEWTVIRSMSGLVRHVRTSPCPAHTLRSVARP